MYKMIVTYCQLLWTWTILHFFGVVESSPFISLLLAAIFTTFHQSFYFEKAPITRRLIIILFEFAVAFVVFFKSGFKFDVLENLTLFVGYNVYLATRNKSFFSVYFKKMREIGNKNSTIQEYAKDRFEDLFK